MTDKISEEHKEILKSRISLNKFGNPKDVANTVAFLCSDLSDYIMVKQFMLMVACIFVDKVIKIFINDIT